MSEEEQTICRNCERLIRFRQNYWPPDMQNKWVHLQGEGVEEVRCFGVNSVAEPKRTNKDQEI